MNSALTLAGAFDKLHFIEEECQRILRDRPTIVFGEHGLVMPARDAKVVASQQMPKRLGLQSAEGQARLLHDLGSIELQAMELGLRTLYEFAEAPQIFREGLVDIVLEEAKHFRLCLEGIQNLGFSWGAWPVHNTLWRATAETDSIIDRLLIVNCYLEASGLDAGQLLLRKLSGVENPIAKKVVDVIAREEVGHVTFGLKWYREFCLEAGLDSSDDFAIRLRSLAERIPPRAVPVNSENRKLVGFSDRETQFMAEFSERKVAERHI